MPIGCGDAPVFPGDVMVGDAEGVIVIPAHLADEIADEAVEMTAFEDFVTEQVAEGPLHPRPLSGDRRADADRLRGLAEGEGAVDSGTISTVLPEKASDSERDRVHHPSEKFGETFRRAAVRHGRTGRRQSLEPVGVERHRADRADRQNLSQELASCIHWSLHPRHRAILAPCCAAATTRDFETIYTIINDGAQAYKGVIPADRWTEPYMSRDKLRHEIADGVTFWGFEENGELAGVMGLQDVQDVTLIRHAYVRTASRNQGIGGTLLSHLRTITSRPVLIGTWADAVWAIGFYEKHGFRVVDPREKNVLLGRYWKIPDASGRDVGGARRHQPFPPA